MANFWITKQLFRTAGDLVDSMQASEGFFGCLDEVVKLWGSVGADSSQLCFDCARGPYDMPYVRLDEGERIVDLV